ncbi:hypothetical protein P691DRAFT_778871 [Macrolepiota fuliginosa MF-IS2]|uniref:F-box domain-containing protein n=1 Tax=Macrolepiota fuliginosa MF-IS2 TaxID=1400762 RepID=A0A9P5X3N0_9AGAR|nr:hypothetical protein P691DRAFT_778871 [Macrolepiota fuliginosa MF-IS2]
MNEHISSLESLSLTQGGLLHIQEVGRPIDHTALGDRVPFMLGSRQMAAFVATMSPERQEAFEVQMAEQRAALRLQEKRRARQMVNSSTTAIATRPVKVTLLDLPPEILTYILLHLPFTSVVICGGVSRHLQVLISGSAELQYYIHLGVYGMADNPRCDLPISERLNRLLVRERRQEEFDFDFEKIIDVPVVAEHRRRYLSAGVFSILYESGVLRQVQIPSEAGQEVEWKEIRTAPFLIHSGTRSLEQDLHILTTAQPQTVYTNAAKPHTIHEVQVHLNQLSTGKPHPDAQRTISFKMREEFGRPRAGMGCVGDNLLLVLRDEMEEHKPDDQVYVYDWKTGERKLEINAPFGSYSSPLFLTTHTFLLPNKKNGGVEYWRIPEGLSEAHTPDQPFFILSLPPLSSGNMFRRISLNAEPQPAGGLQAASKPFYTDPHRAIIVTQVTIQPVDRSRMTVFSFFVHRNSFVECLDIFSPFISSSKRPIPVPYDDWGPSVCRWFSGSADGYDMGSLGGMFGQRYASAARGMGPLIVFNFNPIDVAKVLVARKRHILKTKTRDEKNQNRGQSEGNQYIEGNQGEEYAGKGKKVLSQTRVPGISPEPFTQGPQMSSSSSEPWLQTKMVTRALDPLDDPDHCFEDTVYSSLPYTMRSSQDNYDFANLLLGDEYMLGIQRDGGWTRIKQLHVFHYG